MVQLQIISKIINSSSNAIIEDNCLDIDFFSSYKEEFEFIESHYKEYGRIPDYATFLNKFPEIELVDVNESDRYLVDAIREEHLYSRMIPVLKKSADLLKYDSNDAITYLMNEIKSNLRPHYHLGGVDIISQGYIRYDEFIDKQLHEDSWFFTTGFPELDTAIHGIQRTEELVVLFARTNQGKSWVLEKIVTHIWQIGFSVGYISPEMTPTSIGYRFDTLNKNFSNIALLRGSTDFDANKYKDYIDDLKVSHSNKFIVSTPADFDKTVTVSKLRNYVKQYELDVLAIDGIKYMTDERKQRGDNLTTSLTNISEDLMALSIELGIPIIVVVQANRGGSMVGAEEGTPELESIRDSDGIAQNASKVIAIRQSDGVLELGIKKQRFGAVGGKLKYSWSIDIGDFVYIPTMEDKNSSNAGFSNATKKPKMNDRKEIF